MTDEQAEAEWMEHAREIFPEVADWIAEIGKNNPISFSHSLRVVANNPTAVTADGLFEHDEREAQIVFQEATTMRDPSPLGL